MNRPNFLFPFFFVALLFPIFFAVVAHCQTIRGKVVDRNGLGIPNVIVSVSAINKKTLTAADGTFRISNIPPGNYRLRLARIGYKGKTVRFSVSERRGGDTLSIIMESHTISLKKVVVTAEPRPTSISRVSQFVSVVDKQELAANVGSSPSSGLSDLPGVSMVHSGPFTEKPVIRGLGYQRVVILEDGMRHEYQSWDDDDSPGIDALSLQRIEVVRGPNSVLYGSDALGGVINYIHDDGTLQGTDTSAMRGSVTLEGLTNNTEGALHAGLSGKTEEGRYYLDVTARGAGNVQTPHGALPNTGGSELDFEGSVGPRISWGKLLVGYSRFQQHRNILALGNDDDNDGASPYQLTTHDRAWFSYKSLPSLSAMSVDLEVQQNSGAEYTDDDAPSPINNLRQRAASVNAKYYYTGLKDNSATIGVSGTELVNATLGPEPVIPAFGQTDGALFLFDDYHLYDFDLSAGARYDHRYLKTSSNTALNLTGQTRTYHAFTGSLGLLWHASDAFSLGMDVGSGWRAPNVDELFINGLQEGSLMYKMGNPNLLPEQSFSTDINARISGNSISGEISAYYNRISRYIYLGPTGSIDSASGFMKYLEDQANATLAGADARLSGRITKRFTLTLGGDFIIARNEDAHTWLPLTPANRIILQVRYDFRSTGGFREPYFAAGSDIVFSQNRTAPHELRTGGYTVFNLHFGCILTAFQRNIRIDCQVHNLLNRAYYDNMSLYRLYGYEPGFDFRFNVTVPFVVIG